MAKKVRKTKEYRKPSQFVEQRGEILDRQLSGRQPNGTTNESKSNPMLLISAGLVACLFLFVYYHVITLTQMKDLSDGLAMPDQQIFGYTADDIENLRNATDADAKGQLNYLHKTAGLLFPLFTAVFGMLVFIQWIPDRKMRWLAWSAPLGFAVVDIWENFAIDSLMSAETVTSGAVLLASILTTIRWALLLITAGLILGLAVLRARRAIKGRLNDLREQ